MNYLKSTTPLIADGVRLFNIYFDFAMNYLQWAYPDGETQLATDSQLKEYWMDLDNHRRHGGRENEDGGYYYFPPEYSLCDDEARPGCIPELTFEKPDTKTFRNLALAFDALRTGGNAPAVLNAANEIAVARFLRDELTFLDLPRVVEHALERVTLMSKPSLDDLVASDAEARRVATEWRS